MALLAYTIFTTTLVLQRKEAARGLALGLASLVVPLVPLLALSRLPIEALFVDGDGHPAVPRTAPARGPDLPERAMMGRPGHAAAAGRYPLAARGSLRPPDPRHSHHPDPSDPTEARP